MLPNILDVAYHHAIILDERTLKKEEVRAKCPFCLEDSNNGRHYLSLNTSSNLYKCWNCKARGGVLDFISRLTGESYEIVKEKYCQGRGRNKPSLNTRQLEAIGLEKQSIQISKEVLRKWEQYENSQLSKWFAEFVVCSYLPLERSTILFDNIVQQCKKSPIRNGYERISSEFYKEDHLKAGWALEGLKIANVSWQMAVDNNFFENVVSNVSFVHFLAEKRKESMTSQQYSQRA